jgi:hypothetical protein
LKKKTEELKAERRGLLMVYKNINDEKIYKLDIEKMITLGFEGF